MSQVENYHVNMLGKNGLVAEKAQNRQGMRWAALINSPPMYLLDPLENLTTTKSTGHPCCRCQAQPGQPAPPLTCCAPCNPFPAVSEATQAWLSTILYDAPAQVKNAHHKDPCSKFLKQCPSVDPAVNADELHLGVAGEK